MLEPSTSHRGARSERAFELFGKQRALDESGECIPALWPKMFVLICYSLGYEPVRDTATVHRQFAGRSGSTQHCRKGLALLGDGSRARNIKAFGVRVGL